MLEGKEGLGDPGEEITRYKPLGESGLPSYDQVWLLLLLPILLVLILQLLHILVVLLLVVLHILLVLLLLLLYKLLYILLVLLLLLLHISRFSTTCK